MPNETTSGYTDLPCNILHGTYFWPGWGTEMYEYIEYSSVLRVRQLQNQPATDISQYAYLVLRRPGPFTSWSFISIHFFSSHLLLHDQLFIAPQGQNPAFHGNPPPTLCGALWLQISKTFHRPGKTWPVTGLPPPVSPIC